MFSNPKFNAEPNFLVEKLVSHTVLIKMEILYNGVVKILLSNHLATRKHFFSTTNPFEAFVLVPFFHSVLVSPFPRQHEVANAKTRLLMHGTSTLKVK